MADSCETKKSGYLDIKQSSKVKGRKLKTWRRRWVVVSKMTDLAAGTLAARVDIYPNACRQDECQGDRVTFILDHLTSVQRAVSKTHPFAFELVEQEPVLVLSAASEEESSLWIAALRHLFFADEHIDHEESYAVTIQPNKDSLRFGLSGPYTMQVSSDGVSLKTCSVTPPSSPNNTKTLPATLPTHNKPSTPTASGRRLSERHDEGTLNMRDNSGTAVVEEEVEVMSWRLSMLKRFDVEREAGTGLTRIFVLDCGPNSPSGEATFRFIAKDANSILSSIRKCISIAMEKRRRTGSLSSNGATTTAANSSPRSRAISTVTGYQTLLERSAKNKGLKTSSDDLKAQAIMQSMFVKDRTGSVSSDSTITPVSPFPPAVDVTMAGDSVSINFDDQGMTIPHRQRVSVVSMPGSISGSPKNSDMFGSDFQHRQALGMQQWQANQSTAWQQQQQQQQQEVMQENSNMLGVLPTQQQVVPWNPPQSVEDQQRQLQLWVQQQQQLQQQSPVPKPPSERVGIIRNFSVPNVPSMADNVNSGYDKIEDEVSTRARASSMTPEKPRASGSVCSADSGVVVTEPTYTRMGNNSIDSTVSMDCSAVPRKISDGIEAVAEVQVPAEPHPECNPDSLDEKATSQGSNSHIYQDLDSVKAEGRMLRRFSSFGLERRHHSTGDLRLDNDYEELDGLRKRMEPAVSVAQMDVPPALPARPASFFIDKNKPGNRGWMSSVGLSRGLGTMSFRELKSKDSPSAGMLSRSGSSDLYSTIPDFDPRRRFSRNSLDATLVTSQPDLHSTEGHQTARSTTAKMSASVTGAEIRTMCGPSAQSLNLLTFSDNDISSDGNKATASGWGVRPDHKIDTKSALMEFFLNDDTFHSNPMVTGDLSTGRALPTSITDTNTSSDKSNAREGWADFSNSSDFGNFQKSSDPWFESKPTGDGITSPTSPLSPESPTCSAWPGDEGTGSEGVYIDMRKRDNVGEDSGCDYVAPQGLAKDQAVLDFLLFQ